MSKGLGLLLLGGGGAWLAYQFGLLCPFGLGPSCAPPAAAPPPGTPPSSAPPAGGAAPPAPTTTPSGPAPGSTSFSLVGPVAPDINNSIKGQVSISGSTVALNCIPPGTIYQGADDVTAKLVGQGVDPSAICTAMANALQAQTAAAGTKPTPVTASTIAGMQAMVTQLRALLPMQPSLQAQIDTLNQQIITAKAAAGLSGYSLYGLSGRKKPALYALPPRRGPINYVRKGRLA